MILVHNSALQFITLQFCVLSCDLCCCGFGDIPGLIAQEDFPHNVRTCICAILAEGTQTMRFRKRKVEFPAPLMFPRAHDKAPLPSYLSL